MTGQAEGTQELKQARVSKVELESDRNETDHGGLPISCQGEGAGGDHCCPLGLVPCGSVHGV